MKKKLYNGLTCKELTEHQKANKKYFAKLLTQINKHKKAVCT